MVIKLRRLNEVDLDSSFSDKLSKYLELDIPVLL